MKECTKKQQVVSLSTAESELYAAGQNSVRRPGDLRVWQRCWVLVCGLNLHLDATATMCLVNSRGLGMMLHVDMQNLWIQKPPSQRGSSRRRSVLKREPRRLDDETTTGTKDRADYEKSWAMNSWDNLRGKNIFLV